MNRHSPSSNERRPGPARDPEKRVRILDAAVKIFASKGFFNARVSEIAERAGVADGTIYLYFRNKDDLLISVFEDRMDELLTGLREALRGIAPGSAKLDAVMNHLLAFALANPEVVEVLTVEVRQSTKFMKEYANPKFREYLDLVAGVVAEGQQAGHFRPDVAPHVVARGLYGAMDEICLQHVLAGRNRSGLTAAQAQLRSIFTQGLLPPNPGGKS